MKQFTELLKFWILSWKSLLRQSRSKQSRFGKSPFLKLTLANPCIAIFAIGLSLSLSFQAHACPTCGLNKSFSPQMLVLSMGFALLPLSIMIALGWRIYREHQDKKSRGFDTTQRRN